MTKLEKIQDLLAGVETDIRKATIKDIVETLKDFLKDGAHMPGEAAGLRAAIEIIQENY